MADFFSGLNESALFPALFNVIEMRKKKEEQEKALKALGSFFSKDQATYSPQSFARPQGDQYGVPRVTQPSSPQSVNFQTVPTVPSPNDWGFISALINAAQLGVPTGPISEAVRGAQPTFEEMAPGTYYGERRGTTFKPQGQAPFKPPDTSSMMGSPTELARYQGELMQIRTANPNDPRIPQYEDMIEKLTRGVPYFTLAQTSQGFVPVNARTGAAGPPSGLVKPLTGEMITAEQQIGGLKESLETVKSLYKPEYVGAVAGRIGGLKELTVGVPEDQGMFYSALADIGNTLIYLKSGKQINEAEYQRLKRQLPDKDLPESTFNARMQEFERELNSVISNRRAAQGGYGIPGQKIVDDPLGILK